MVEADTINLVANLATSLALVAAVIFGLAQFRQNERKRREIATMELMHSFTDPEFSKAFTFILALPVDMTSEQAGRLPPEQLIAIRAVGHSLEALGLMVYNRSVPINSVEALIGSNIREIWRRIRPFAEWRRMQAGDETPFEWTQWLAERLEERAKNTPRRGAFVAFKDWT